MCVYLRAKFEVSSVIRTSFRRGNFKKEIRDMKVLHINKNFEQIVRPVKVTGNNDRLFQYLI